MLKLVFKGMMIGAWAGAAGYSLYAWVSHGISDGLKQAFSVDHPANVR